ncbi:MAG: tetratricopeptide repeat protein [Myxococcota bacterium]
MGRQVLFVLNWFRFAGGRTVRHAGLIEQLQRAVSEQCVRVTVLHSPRGLGRTWTLGAFAEELGGRGERVDVVDAQRFGVVEGGCLDALLRLRLGLAPDAPSEAVRVALDARAAELDPLSREFLAFVLGAEEATFETSRLDPAARWEGAVAELARFLTSGAGPWVWCLDDASFVDTRTIQVLELLGQTFGAPGLVVLAAAEEELAGLEVKLKALIAADRCNRVTLPLPSLEGLAQDFSQPIVAAARGVPLTAALLKAAAAPPVASTLESAVRAVVAGLTDLERAALDVVCVAGGRLPESALDATLGGFFAQAAEALEHKRLCGRGATRRFPGTRELFVRHGWLVEERRAASARASRGWLGTLGVWAENELKREGVRHEHLSLVLPLLIRSAEAMGDSERASLALELWHRADRVPEALTRAAAGARGVRRLVLARRAVEDRAFRGEVAQAVADAAAAVRAVPQGATTPPPGWAELLFQGVEDELERWDRLTLDEASVSVELARAEALSQLGRANETLQAFQGVEARLSRLPNATGTDALWLRWARTWSWFQAEMLADGPAARAVCERVRKAVSPDSMARSFHAPGFLRAEQIAHSRGGDPARAEALADELILVSRQRGSQREECVAWNARALLHLREGELAKARSGFERSLDLARKVGFRRREAIALHNLGLTLCRLGEYGASLACQERYLALSERIGNFVARAYAPAAMAQVMVQQHEVARAEEHLSLARKAAEENGWPGLVAWTRHLSGLLKLGRHCEKRDTLQLSLARADFMACLDLLEDRKAGWSEELAPAEVASCLVLSWLLANNEASARAALPRAERLADESPVSARFVSAVRDVLDAKEPTEALDWFEQHGHARERELWRRFLPALQLERRRALKAQQEQRPA